MSALTFKCPNCDGGLIFDPESQKFACEYCMSKFTEAELESQNPTSKAASVNEKSEDTSHEFEDNAVAYSCPSCGAEVVTDATTAATFCYYCHNPVVLAGRLDGNFKPDKVVPFEIQREDAIQRFLQWTKKKWFIPKYFFSKEQIDKITGVYFPHWVVDSDICANINAEGNIVKTWISGNTQYTKTDTYQVIREAEIHLEDITKSALKKANRQLVDGVHPFSDKSMKDFTMAYLSGFQAEKRDIERSELDDVVLNEIIGYASNLMMDTATGYRGIGSNDVTANIKSIDWSYALLPVWTLTYKGNDGKVYYYAMNGQSGKVCGKLPVDFKRLAILFGSVAAPLSVLLILGGLLL